MWLWNVGCRRMALPMWGRPNDEQEGGPRPCDMITPLLLLLQVGWSVRLAVRP
ncbi:hypothetical protein LINPERHAP2_LOCUS9587 [Linum perenne]